MPNSAAMVFWTILGLSVAGMAAPTDGAQAATTDRVLIMEVSRGPGVPSGILATAIRFVGRSGGKTSVYYIPFFDPDQPRPRVGETCEVAWRWQWTQFSWIVGDGGTVTEGRFVQSWRCADRRWPD
jgi:hypothetical protein